MKTVKEIVKEYLIANGYDGLINVDTECGCGVDALEPCGEMNSECQAAYKWICTEITCDGAMCKEYRTERDTGPYECFRLKKQVEENTK